MVPNRRVRAGSGANREERVIEQEQTKHETNRAPGKTRSHISGWSGEIAHSLHFIIDASAASFALRPGFSRSNTSETRVLQVAVTDVGPPHRIEIVLNRSWITV